MSDDSLDLTLGAKVAGFVTGMEKASKAAEGFRDLIKKIQEDVKAAMAEMEKDVKKSADKIKAALGGMGGDGRGAGAGGGGGTGGAGGGRGGRGADPANREAKAQRDLVNRGVTGAKNLATAEAKALKESAARRERDAAARKSIDDQLIASAQKVRDELAAANADITKSDKALAKARETARKKLEAINEQLAASARATAAATAEAAEDMVKAAERAGKATVKAAKTAATASAQNSAAQKAASREIVKTLEDQAAAVDKANKSAADNFNELGGKIKSAILNIQNAAAVVATTLAFKKVITASSDFETRIAEVSTLLTEGSVPIQDYREQLLELSQVTGKGLIDTTKGLYQVISAGIPAVKGAGGAFDVLTAAEKGAIGGLATVEETVDVLTTVLNAYQGKAGSAMDVTDKLFSAVIRGKTTLPQLAQQFGDVATNAASFGVSIDEALSGVATLTKFGINTAEATTALNQTILGIVKPTQDEAKAFEALGIEVGAVALEQKGFANILKEVNDAVGRFKGPAAVLADMFSNVRALRGAVVLGGAGFESFIADIEASKNSAGLTENAFQKLSQTFELQAGILKNKIGVALIRIGETVMPRVLGIVQRLGNYLTANGRAIAEGFSKFLNAVISLGEWVVKHGKGILTFFGTLFAVVALSKFVGLFVLLIDGLKASAAATAAARTATAGLAAAQAAAAANAATQTIAIQIQARAVAELAAAEASLAAATTAAAGAGTAAATAAIAASNARVAAAQISVVAAQQAVVAGQVAGANLAAGIRAGLAAQAGGLQRVLSNIFPLAIATAIGVSLGVAIADAMGLSLQGAIDQNAPLREEIARRRKIDADIKAKKGGFDDEDDQLAQQTEEEKRIAKADFLVKSGKKIRVKSNELLGIETPQVSSEVTEELLTAAEIFKRNPDTAGAIFDAQREGLEGGVQTAKAALEIQNAQVDKLKERLTLLEDAASAEKEILRVQLEQARTPADKTKAQSRIAALEKESAGRAPILAVQEEKSLELEEELRLVTEGRLHLEREILEVVERKNKEDYVSVGMALKKEKADRLAAKLARDAESARNKADQAAAKIAAAAAREEEIIRKSGERQEKMAAQTAEMSAKTDATSIKRDLANFDRETAEGRPGEGGFSGAETRKRTGDTEREIAEFELERAIGRQEFVNAEIKAAQDVANAEIKAAEQASVEIGINAYREANKVLKRTDEAQAAALAEALTAQSKFEAERVAIIRAAGQKTSALAIEQFNRVRDAQNRITGGKGDVGVRTPGEIDRTIDRSALALGSLNHGAQKLNDAVKSFFTNFGQKFQGVIDGAVDALTGAANAVVEAPSGLFKLIQNTFRTDEEEVAASKARFGAEANARTSFQASKQAQEVADKARASADAAFAEAGITRAEAKTLQAAMAARQRRPGGHIAGYADAKALTEPELSALTADAERIAARVGPSAQTQTAVAALVYQSRVEEIAVAKKFGAAINQAKLEKAEVAEEEAKAPGLFTAIKDFAVQTAATVSDLAGADLGGVLGAIADFSLFAPDPDKVAETAALDAEAAALAAGKTPEEAKRLAELARAAAKAAAEAVDGPLMSLAKKMGGLLIDAFSIAADLFSSVVAGPIASALAAPLQALAGGLSGALGVLTSVKVNGAYEGIYDSNRAVTEFEKRGIVKDAEQAIDNAGQDALNIASVLSAALAPMAVKFINQIIELFPKLIASLADTLAKVITAIAPLIGPLLVTVINALVDALPVVIDALVTALPQILDGLFQGLIALVKRAPDIVIALIDGIVEMLPGLFEAIAANLPELIVTIAEAIPKIIESIADGIPKMIDAVIVGVFRIVTELIKNAPAILWAVAKAVVFGALSLLEAFFLDIPVAVIGGIAIGLKEMFEELVKWLKSFLPGNVIAGGGDPVSIAGIRSAGGRQREQANRQPGRVESVSQIDGRVAEYLSILKSEGVGQTSLAQVAQALGVRQDQVADALRRLQPNTYQGGSAVNVYHRGGIARGAGSDMAGALGLALAGAPRFNLGGLVDQPGGQARRALARVLRGDEVPAVLQAGEGVINRAGMRGVGEDGLARLNRGQDVGGAPMGLRVTLAASGFAKEIMQTIIGAVAVDVASSNGQTRRAIDRHVQQAPLMTRFVRSRT